MVSLRKEICSMNMLLTTADFLNSLFFPEIIIGYIYIWLY